MPDDARKLLLDRLEVIANRLSALHNAAVQLNMTPDHIEEAIASLERFIEQESSTP